MEELILFIKAEQLKVERMLNKIDKENADPFYLGQSMMLDAILERAEEIADIEEEEESVLAA